MKSDRTHVVQGLLWLLAVSFLIRALIAGFFELGNDEVYYWTYAMYPDISHYDHPPMVGWLIRAFTFNLNFQQEFFVRLASVVFGTINTWLIYLLGKRLKDDLTGLYAAVLYTASLYGFIITGVFILPDTPQTLFWLLALLLMTEILPISDPGKQHGRKMLRIGICLGLGMLSKYTTLFLWAGMLMYILMFNRVWLKKGTFYLANLIMLAFFSIVLVWNFQNAWVSFTYQGGRGVINELLVNYNTFFSEIGGEILYYNPVNFILLIIAFIVLFRVKTNRRDPRLRILLLSGIPIILVFWLVSLFRGTLPHWTGPGYMTLIPLIALWVRNRQKPTARLLPLPVLVSVLVLFAILTAGILQVTTGFLPIETFNPAERQQERRDYSLDIYGWRQLGEKFKPLAEQYEKQGSMQPGSPIVTFRWFPAANLEYYVAIPSGRPVLATGNLDAIHKYAWINRSKGGFRLNSDAWYITSNREFHDPLLLPFVYYKGISDPDTIKIDRNGRTAYCFYVYRLSNLQSKPPDVLKSIE